MTITNTYRMNNGYCDSRDIHPTNPLGLYILATRLKIVAPYVSICLVSEGAP